MRKKLTLIFLILALFLVGCSDKKLISEKDAKIEKLSKELADKKTLLKKQEDKEKSLTDKIDVLNKKIKELEGRLKPYEEELKKAAEEQELAKKLGNYNSDIDIQSMVREPKKYEGSLIKYYGEVGENKIVENGRYLSLLVRYNRDDTTTIIAFIEMKSDLVRPVKGDNITIYGEMIGVGEIVDGYGVNTQRPIIKVHKVEVE